MALLEHLEGEVRKRATQALGDLRVLVGVAEAAQRVVDGSLETAKRVEIELGGLERSNDRLHPGRPLCHPRWRRSRRWRGWFDPRPEVGPRERRHHLFRRKAPDPVVLSPDRRLGRVQPIVPRPRGFQQREALQPLPVLRGEGKARGSSGGVADQVEAVEPRGLGGSQDSLDLRIEPVVGRGLLAHVDLEVIRQRLDLVTEGSQQLAISQVGRKHGPGKQDHMRPGIHEISSGSCRTSVGTEPISERVLSDSA